MRKLFALVAILIINTALSVVQTLDDMGIHAYVGPLDEEKYWEIPYEFNGDCTAFFTAILQNGELWVYDENTLLLHTSRAGKYRVILGREGVMKIILKRLPGKQDAQLSGKSFLACDRVPVVEMDVHTPKLWSVGGYTKVLFRFRNLGTAEANGILIIHNPWNAAPLSPPGKIRIPAGEELNVTISMLTTQENSKVLFPRQCFEYYDSYGKSEVCVESRTFSAEKNVPIGCFVRADKIELFNMGYTDFELNGKNILPRDSIFMGVQEEFNEDSCAIHIEIQKIPFKENTNRSEIFAVILTLLGVIGILLPEKKLKTSKA